MKFEPITFKNDRCSFTMSNNICILIGINGIGKSYLLDHIKYDEFFNSKNQCGYNAESIFMKYFSKYFKYYGGSGYESCMRLCEKLASNSNPIIINNPENNIHIGVQEKIINVIRELYEDTNVSVIIETQSPNIIHGHFDILSHTEEEK